MSAIRKILSVLSLLIIGSASLAGPQSLRPATEQDIAALAGAIRSLGPGVDPAEAHRAARIAFNYSYQLAQEYQITDPPVIHNTKVNMGTRPRGLCWHWAQDIEARLKRENFRTLDLHRAVAPPRNVFRLEHSTAIISGDGDSFDQGIILDPWRNGGWLYWAPTRADPRYDWLPRDVVLNDPRRKRAHKSRVRTAHLSGGRK